MKDNKWQGVVVDGLQHLMFSLLTAVPICVQDVGMDICIPCCFLPGTCLLAQVTIRSSLSECVIRCTMPSAKTLQLLH